MDFHSVAASDTGPPKRFTSHSVQQCQSLCWFAQPNVQQQNQQRNQQHFQQEHFSQHHFQTPPLSPKLTRIVNAPNPSGRALPRSVQLLSMPRQDIHRGLNHPIVPLYYGNSTSGYYRDEMPSKLQEMPSKRQRMEEADRAQQALEAQAAQEALEALYWEQHTNAIVAAAATTAPLVVEEAQRPPKRARIDYEPGDMESQELPNQKAPTFSDNQSLHSTPPGYMDAEELERLKQDLFIEEYPEEYPSENLQSLADFEKSLLDFTWFDNQ